MDRLPVETVTFILSNVQEVYDPQLKRVCGLWNAIIKNRITIEFPEPWQIFELIRIGDPATVTRNFDITTESLTSSLNKMCKEAYYFCGAEMTYEQMVGTRFFPTKNRFCQLFISNIVRDGHSQLIKYLGNKIDYELQVVEGWFRIQDAIQSGNIEIIKDIIDLDSATDWCEEAADAFKHTDIKKIKEIMQLLMDHNYSFESSCQVPNLVANELFEVLRELDINEMKPFIKNLPSDINLNDLQWLIEKCKLSPCNTFKEILCSDRFDLVPKICEFYGWTLENCMGYVIEDMYNLKHSSFLNFIRYLENPIVNIKLGYSTGTLWDILDVYKYGAPVIQATIKRAIFTMDRKVFLWGYNFRFRHIIEECPEKFIENLASYPVYIQDWFKNVFPGYDGTQNLSLLANKDFIDFVSAV